ncbi:GlxA family transcriptional regulator [Ruegeria arenilitoris]|uniref:GlxA family transcriptional regulator n=1 Tax=Ruegeria arenilitoris TaxID=1173585 RepID=UPI00147A0B0C|nr:helix-turn-helix domain-containing protein [Ruegeria arenilitoris]
MANVTFILFPKFQMLAYVLASETLRVANKCAGREVFRWQTRSATNLPVQASNGALIAPDTVDWQGGPDADLILLCAGYDPLDHLTARVRAFASRARRSHSVIGGVDTGTVILAELGLLDGAKAVLHYEAEAAFRERWPEIEIMDQIYCLDRRRLTAAGGTATGDAVLAWIARDVDRELASHTANGIVHGEARRSETPQRNPNTADPVLLMMHQLMVENVSEPVSIKDICGRLGVSEKQLRGRCVATYSQTPSAYYQERRLEVGHHFITNSQLSITEIAQTSGFESLSSFSRAIRIHYGASPKQIRKRTSKP